MKTEFIPIKLDDYVKLHFKSNPDTDRAGFVKDLRSKIAAAKKGVRCACGNPIWVIGSVIAGHACFTCITGESYPESDYEIDEVCHLHGATTIKREKIKYGDSVSVRLSPRERDLITKHLFADPALTARLNLALVEGESIIVRYSLDDLDILLGEIAAVSNHTKNKKLGKELDALFEHIQELMESYEEVE